MSLNLNYSHNPEYNLYNNVTDELISMYGILCKYCVTEKVHLDLNTFGEWTTLKAENNDVHEVFLLPDTQESWQGQNIMFDQFGLGNFSTMEFYISEKGLHSIFPNWESSVNLDDMISDLILMPSGKVLEVTHIEPLVEGVNNLFAYDDTKNTIKITCRNYEFRKDDELNIDDIDRPLQPAEKEAQENLDDYFTRLIDTDEIPDEDYAAKPGQNKILDYRMEIEEVLFIADSLMINGVDAGTTPTKTSEELNIIESSSSIKTKQDIKSEKPIHGAKEITEKDGEYSSPFGALG